MPKEIQHVLANISISPTDFEWQAEYVTEFNKFGLGKGEGRNHDAFLFNSEIVIGIEAKADEPFGSEYIGDALKTASKNKLCRIENMIRILFGNSHQEYADLRYQLVTATTALLLEAKKRNVQKALFMVIVFKKNGYYSEIKIQKNEIDIQKFIAKTNGKACGDYYLIPTHFGNENRIDLYFCHFEITVDE